jgi:hypothetical protein
MRLFARLGNCSMRCSTSCIHAVVEQEQKSCLICGSYFIPIPKRRYQKMAAGFANVLHGVAESPMLQWLHYAGIHGKSVSNRCKTRPRPG